MQLRVGVSVVLSCLVAAPAFAQPKLNKDPCVMRARNSSSRFLRDVKLDATALTYCTGNDCWSYDLKAAIKSIPTAKKIAGDAMPAKPAESDPRAKASLTDVSFCPTPETCKTFKYKVKFEPASTPIATMNAEGTLGALRYDANPMIRGQWTQHFVFDLVKGKQIKQHKGEDSMLFTSSYAIDNVLYSGAGKKLGKLAVKDTRPPWAAVPGASAVVLVDIDKGNVVVQDVKKGKAKPAIKSGFKEINWNSQVRVSADGKLAFVVLDNPDEGEVLSIDLASNKLLGRAAPPMCPADSSR